jgi:hypothetical protein
MGGSQMSPRIQKIREMRRQQRSKTSLEYGLTPAYRRPEDVGVLNVLQFDDLASNCNQRGEKECRRVSAPRQLVGDAGLSFLEPVLLHAMGQVVVGEARPLQLGL